MMLPFLAIFAIIYFLMIRPQVKRQKEVQKMLDALKKGDKVIVFKYKAKVRYRNKTGHRSIFTKLAIDKIVEPGVAPEEPVKKVRRRKKEVTESGT